MAATANSPFSASNSPIRPATFADVPALTRLINAAFVVESVAFDGDRVDEQGVRGYMSTGTFLVAEDVAGLSGCVYVECNRERSYLGLLSVAPHRQGLGLGRRLVAEAEKFARESGCVVNGFACYQPAREAIAAVLSAIGVSRSGRAALSTQPVQ